MFFTLGIADDGEGGRQQPLLDPASSALGFFAIIGLSIAFGTMYLPVKRHNMGNGTSILLFKNHRISRHSYPRIIRGSALKKCPLDFSLNYAMKLQHLVRHFC